jgi:hypothetical protein
MVLDESPATLVLKVKIDITTLNPGPLVESNVGFAFN